MVGSFYGTVQAIPEQWGQSSLLFYRFFLVLPFAGRLGFRLGGGFLLALLFDGLESRRLSGRCLLS
jgi:hypothetical protein